MTNQFNIAGHTIRISGRGSDLATIDGFSIFRRPLDLTEAVMNLDMECDMEDFNPDSVKVMYRSDLNGVEYLFGRWSGGYFYRMSDAVSPRPLLLKHYDNSTRMQSNASLDMPFNPYNVRFMLWVAYGLATLPARSVAVHTSTIMYDGRAYMFLGESGTGKSTHTSLWRKYIAGSELLNDDSPILRIIDSRPVVFGSAWSGKTPCFKDMTLPLGGIVRLSQAPYNKIRRLSKIEALGAVFPSCPPAFAYDEHLTDMMCGVLSSTIACTPVFHLECLPDRDAAMTSFAALTGHDYQ